MAESPGGRKQSIGEGMPASPFTRRASDVLSYPLHHEHEAAEGHQDQRIAVMGQYGPFLSAYAEKCTRNVYLTEKFNFPLQRWDASSWQFH